MYLEYGSVVLKVIDLTRFERTTVWTPDGTDLIGVDTIIGVTATYAPGGVPRLVSVRALSPDTSDTLTGRDTTKVQLDRNPRGLSPGAAAPILPKPLFEPGGRAPVPRAFERAGPETDAELRGRLWVPRQKLILWAYDRQTGLPIRWLESPRPGFDTDAANGPIPLSVDIVSASGEPNSVAVHFQVETRMSPCPTGSDRLVLSHRWEMTHGYDQDYYLTRSITGQIIFNGALLYRSEPRRVFRPDFVRAQFLHPIPLGFQRRVPQITQSSDGLTIHYVITDTDPTICFSPGDSAATRIELLERMQQTVTPMMGPGNE
jgi:hypothetical protein